MVHMPQFKERQIQIATIVLGTITTLLIGIVGFQFVSTTFVRASNVAPKNLAITQITTSSAQVTWASDQASQSVIEYGTTPTSLTFFAPEAISTKEHSVELNLLSANSTYYFQVRTGDQKYDNGGVPWTFTTASEVQASPAASTNAPDSTSSASTTTGVSATPVPVPSIATTPTSAPMAALTAAPTAVLSPTPVVKDTSCVLTEYQSNFGTTNAKYDIDSNGIVNFHDWSVCNLNKNGIAPSSTPTSTPGPTSTPTVTPTVTPTP